MKVIIPLAGKGTRLRPHTHTKAKPLVHVAGKPVLGHILDSMKELDIEEIIFITGYLGHQIEEYVSKNYNYKARYIEQKELNGQAPAVALAREFVKDDVIIWFVDTISDANISKLKSDKPDGVLYVKEVDDPRRFGQVHANKDGVVDKIVEKADPPVSNLVNIGLYYVKDSKLLFECIDELMRDKKKTKGEYYLMDAFQIMIDKGTKFKAEVVDIWEDCGKPDTLLSTNRYFLEKNRKDNTSMSADCIIIPPVFIDKTAQVKNSIIGPFVSIAPKAKVENSIIRDSILNENAHVIDAGLDKSIIAPNACVHGHLKRLNVGDSSEVTY